MQTTNTLQPIELPLDYSSVGRRLLAFLLDALILLIPMAIGGKIIPVIGGFIVLFFYAPVLEASELRATLGKHLCGIQVCDLMGRRISLRAALIRNLLKIVSTVLLFIGFIFAMFTRKKQSLHDMLADTLVVYGRSDAPVADAWIQGSKDVFNAGSALVQEHKPGSSRAIAELERLQTLREKGALSEEEFQIAKRRILGGL